MGLAREGEPGAAIAALGNRVREAPPEELGLEAGRRWLALAPEHRADTLILAPTHAICRQANDTVREGLAEEGVLRGRTLAVDRLVNRRLTRVQASDIRSYEPGDTVVFHRDVFGCRANDVCIVMGHDDGRVVLAHPDGERRFRPSGNAAGYLGLYDTERIELRAGDRIRWTRNRKAPLARGSHPQAPDLVNGGEAEILEIGYKRVRFRDGEREFSIALTEAARHLQAMPGARAGLEEAVEMLERTRLLDEAERFERAWPALREGAAEIGVPELHAPGHRLVAEAGERLEAAEGLDAHVRRAAAEWRKIDSAQVALAEEVRTLPGRIAAWRERWADLPQDEPGGLDPKHPARRAWREEGGALEAVAGDMLHPEDVHAPYLDAVQGAREAIRQAAEEVREALQDDRYRAFGWLTEEVDQQARDNRTEAFHVPRYGEMIAQAEALSGQEALPARTQEVVTSWLDYHARCETICEQIRDARLRVDAMTADCPERPATLASLRDWRQRAESMIAEARAMLAEDGTHAPHLAAMPGERKALVKATSSLESALLAVEARETKLLSAVVRRSAEELHRDWEAHIGEATAARVDPFYVPGHQELIDRLRELRHDPAISALSSEKLAQIDSILQENQRQIDAIAHVHNYLDKVQLCRNDLKELQDLAHTHKLELEKVHSYDEWHDTAERLFAAGKAIADDRKTYGPCLEHHPGAWSGVHAGIRELGTALGRDITSLHHRHPELYLDPITRPLPDSQQVKDADASYRRLRDEWHKHLARAEATQTHPYEVRDHARLIDAMRELRNLPDLATNAQQALDTLLHDYTHLHRDRQHIHAYLDEAEHALEKYQRFKDTVQKLSPLDVRLEDIEGYGEWKDSALRLADAGEAILADPERYSIHLDDHSDVAKRIRASVALLNTALGRDDASERRERHQSLSEDEKTAERLSQRRGIKL